MNSSRRRVEWTDHSEAAGCSVLAGPTHTCHITVAVVWWAFEPDWVVSSTSAQWVEQQLFCAIAGQVEHLEETLVEFSVQPEKSWRQSSLLCNVTLLVPLSTWFWVKTENGGFVLAGKYKMTKSWHLYYQELHVQNSRARIWTHCTPTLVVGAFRCVCSVKVLPRLKPPYVQLNYNTHTPDWTFVLELQVNVTERQWWWKVSHTLQL